MSKLFATLASEKPHSSITDWVEILSSDRYKENELDGIPELVDAINLQSEGPVEAARAIRKKLKYGNVHRQLRALTLLKALVENCGVKFQVSFSHNEALLSRIKTMASDSLTDEAVKKKLMSVLASWHRQFKDDPKMSVISGLWVACGGGAKPKRPVSHPPPPRIDYEEEARLRAEAKARDKAAREEEKRKDRERKEAERQKKKAPPAAKPKAKPFDFEKEKPLIITSIANASQAAIQLTNALKLVNREQESIETNTTVQGSLSNAKAARKTVVRYIQRVENEELIGTLLDANERIINALSLYDMMLKSPVHDSDEEDATNKLKALSLQPTGELTKLQGKQRAAIERASSMSSLNVNSGGVSRPPGRSLHPDLQDLTFGGNDVDTLPAPLQPRAVDERADPYRQGSLSDYSDYSSEEDERPSTSTTAATSAAGPSYSRRDYDNLIGDEDELVTGEPRKGLLEEEDPFADPFADDGGTSELGTPMLERKHIELAGR